MNRIYESLLGIDRSPGASSAGRSTRLEFSSVPAGLTALVIFALAAAILLLFWRLYRRERPELSWRKRAVLVGLRVVVLLAIAAMLVEPVWVSSFRETIPSHLAIVVDDSESTRFADPYTDETKAAADRLGPEDRRRPGQVAGRAAPRDAPARPPQGGPAPPDGGAGEGARGLRLRPGDGVEDRPGRGGEGAEARGDRPRPRGLAAGGRGPRGPLGPPRAADRRGDPGDGRPIERGRGPDPGRRGRGPAGRADLPRRPRRRRGAEERPARRGRGQPRRLRQGPDDPRRRHRGPRPQGRRGPPRRRAARQRRRLGAGLRHPGRPRRGRRPQADHAPCHPQGHRPVRVPGQGQRGRPRADPGRQRRDRPRPRGPPADPGPDDRRRGLARGPVPPERPPARPARRVRRLAPERRPRLPPGRRPADRAAPVRRRRARPVRRPDPDRPRHAGPRPPVARPDRQLRRQGRRRPDLHAGGIALAAALRGRRARVRRRQVDPDPPRRPRGRPVQDRGRGPPRDPVDLRPGADPRRAAATRSSSSTPTRSGTGPILSSLPGMYWNFPVTRARPGATVLARHGDPRMQNQYGRQVLLASQLYGPGRTVFIGFDSTYRWRYLSEDYFDGFWARLVDRVGRNKALGGRFPFQVGLARSSFRVGDRVAVGVRYTDAAAVAEASELALPRSSSKASPPSRSASSDRADDPSSALGLVRGREGRAPTRSGSPRRPASTPGPRPGPRPRPSASSPPAARSTSPRSTGACWPTWRG